MYIIQSNSNLDTTRFHVAASDRELLNRVTQVLRQKGFVGLWERSGEMRFLVDGRQGEYDAIQQIQQIQTYMRECQQTAYSPEKAQLSDDIHEVLQAAGLERAHRGTTYLAHLIFYLCQPDQEQTNLSKGGYLYLAKKFHTDVRAIDRAIRYAKTRAGHQLANRLFIHQLLEAVWQKRKQVT